MSSQYPTYLEMLKPFNLKGKEIKDSGVLEAVSAKTIIREEPKMASLSKEAPLVLAPAELPLTGAQAAPVEQAPANMDHNVVVTPAAAVPAIPQINVVLPENSIIMRKPERTEEDIKRQSRSLRYQSIKESVRYIVIIVVVSLIVTIGYASWQNPDALLEFLRTLGFIR